MTFLTNGMFLMFSGVMPSSTTVNGTSAVFIAKRPMPPVTNSNRNWMTSGDISTSPGRTSLPPVRELRLLAIQIADGLVVDQ